MKRLFDIDIKEQINPEIYTGGELHVDIPLDWLYKEVKIINKGRPNGYKSTNCCNYNVLYFQWKEFYKKEIEMWYENPMINGMPLQSWLYANRLKYINKGFGQLTCREILRGFKISGLHIGNSFHSPYYIQQFIKDYNIKSIFDPCGGWGHRLLGASKITYIYNDINPVTYSNVKKISDLHGFKDKYFYNEDATKVNPEIKAEATFTCPPYYNTEMYSDKGAENLSYGDFLNWWKKVVINSLENTTGFLFAYIINNQYKKDMNQVILDLGLTHLNEIRLGRINDLNHFQRTAKNITKGEFLEIFTTDSFDDSEFEQSLLF